MPLGDLDARYTRFNLWAGASDTNFLSFNITAWCRLPQQMCKIWISWISTTDFSGVIVGYLCPVRSLNPGAPGGLHNVLAILGGEEPLCAARGVAVGVVDRVLLRGGSGAVLLVLTARMPGQLRGWQSSLGTRVEGWHRLGRGHLKVGIDVHPVWQLLLLLSSRLVLQIQIAAAAPAWVQGVVDVVVVDAVVGVVQAVDGGHPLLLGRMAALAGQLRLARRKGGKGLSTCHCLVQIARLESSPHRDVSVEGEVDWLWQEIAEFIPKARVAPLHQGRVIHQVLQVWELVDLCLADLLQLDEDHLAVVGHDGGDEGRPDLAPLGGEVRPAEDHKGSCRGLDCNRDGVKDRCRWWEVSLVKAKPVRGCSVLKIGSKGLLNKVPIFDRVADEDIKQLVLVVVHRSCLSCSGALCLSVEPLLDTASEGEGKQVSHDDHEDTQQDRDEDRGVVQLAHLARLEVGVNEGILVGARHTLHRCDGLVAEVARDAFQVIPVYDLAAKAPLEGKEGLEEVTVAAPNVAGHVETDQHRVCHKF